MVECVGYIVCGGRWADLMVWGYGLTVPTRNRNDFRAGLSGTPLFTTSKFRRHLTTYSTIQNVNCIVILLIEGYFRAKSKLRRYRLRL
jgi:hypothetical protein